MVLESGNESSRDVFTSNREEPGQNSRLSSSRGNDATPRASDSWSKAAEVVVKEELISSSKALPDEKVVSVKLGKFRNADVAKGRGEGSSSSNAKLEESQRRCFSMGSYEYVMDETCMLQVSINSVKKKKKKLNVKLPGYRSTMSECGCHPTREKNRASDDSKLPELRGNGSGTIAASPPILQKRESFSASKIWLHPRKDKAADRDPSRRAFSFRLPLHRVLSGELKKNQLDLGEEWEKSGSEADLDVEVGSCANSFGSQIEETPSFARRTLLWIVGKHNRVGSSNHN